jgi:hypothetical protein
MPKSKKKSPEPKPGSIWNHPDYGNVALRRRKSSDLWICTLLEPERMARLRLNLRLSVMKPVKGPELARILAFHGQP